MPEACVGTLAGFRHPIPRRLDGSAGIRPNDRTSWSHEMANLPPFTDDNFDAEVNQSDVPVLVDFGAEW